MKKSLALVYGVLALALLALPGLLSLLGVRGENYEKRALASPPALVKDGAYNPSWVTGAADYFDDTFALRGQFISAYGAAMEAAFAQSANPQVIVGRQGYLFFEPTLSDYLRDAPLPQADIDEMARRLIALEKRLAQRGVQLLVTIGPNKNSIYPEMMPGRYRPLDAPGNLDLLGEALANQAFYLDVRPALWARKDETELYHRLDSHWNALGAAIAYDAMADAMGEAGAAMRRYANLPYTRNKSWDGDLVAMTKPALGIKDWQVFLMHGDTSPKEPYPFTANPPMRSTEDVRIHTQSDASEAGQLPKLLIYRDSFTNALIPFIAANAQEALFSRAVPYNFDLLDEIDADIVIIEIVERNIPELLSALPQD